MFVLLYSKDKSQDNPGKETGKDKVQREQKDKNIPVRVKFSPPVQTGRALDHQSPL
jgi:hypothetical protein